MTFLKAGQWYALMAASALTMLADTTTVTVPGYSTNNGSEIFDPFVPNTWLRENFRTGTSVGVSAANPRSGTGSLQYTGTNGGSKADMEIYFSNPFSLGDLAQYSYDWYRSSASTNPAAQVPSFRLRINVNGQGNSVDGSLIFEPYYQTNTNPTTDEWMTSEITASSILWWSQPGSLDTTYNKTLQDWKDGVHTAGFPQLSANSKVMGFSLGVGSGWVGNYNMFVDNVSYTLVGSQESQSYNFEAATPEPASLTLVGAGIAFVLLRRRRNR